MLDLPQYIPVGAERVLRRVRCPMCGKPALLKNTKTDRLMVRCDGCGFLGFANQPASQAIFMALPTV